MPYKRWGIELFSYFDEDFTLQFTIEIKKTQGVLPSDNSLGSGVRIQNGSII
jgi:hypothetical protein